jgi:hypothetical protein
MPYLQEDWEVYSLHPVTNSGLHRDADLARATGIISLPILIRWLQSACFQRTPTLEQEIITYPVPRYLIKQFILFDVTRITLPWVIQSYKISSKLHSRSNLLTSENF